MTNIALGFSRLWNVLYFFHDNLRDVFISFLRSFLFYFEPPREIFLFCLYSILSLVLHPVSYFFCRFFLRFNHKHDTTMRLVNPTS